MQPTELRTLSLRHYQPTHGLLCPRLAIDNMSRVGWRRLVCWKPKMTLWSRPIWLWEKKFTVEDPSLFNGHPALVEGAVNVFTDGSKLNGMAGYGKGLHFG